MTDFDPSNPGPGPGDAPEPPSRPPAPTNCGSCRYSFVEPPPAHSPENAARWECRRHPPAVVQTGQGPYSVPYYGGAFPTVGPELWCGHHALRQ